MRNSIRMSYLSVVLVVLCAAGFVHATQDPHDGGYADTVLIQLASYPDATTGQYHFRLDLYAYDDADTLAGLAAGLLWSNANIHMDSARSTALADSVFDYARFFYNWNSLDSTNSTRRFLFAGARINTPGLMPSAGRLLMAKYYFTATTWTIADSVVFDSCRFSPGSNLRFSETNWDVYKPVFSKRLVLYDVPPPTLVSPGNGDSVSHFGVTLNWDDVLGADRYRVQVDNDSTFASPDRDVSNITVSQWTVTPALSNNTWWYWRVRATDDGTGKTGGWSTKRKFYKTYMQAKFASDDLPTQFALSQNYPNPFNPVTSISYNLPTPSHVKISIYNTLGQVVTTLVDQELAAGRYSVEWRGVGADNRPVASGTYFYRFEGAGHVKTKKMMLLK